MLLIGWILQCHRRLGNENNSMTSGPSSNSGLCYPPDKSPPSGKVLTKQTTLPLDSDLAGG